MTYAINNMAVRLENITIRMGRKLVVRAFSLDVPPGAKITLTGRSGSGKSSILRCILGFITPAEGAVYVLGKRLTAESAWALRARLAYVTQEPDLGAGAVREILQRPFHYRANSHLRHNLERTRELFDRFMLGPELLDQDTAQLSGGEKQRVALVSSILLDRQIFLLDEVTSALDMAAKQAVLDFFRPREDLTIISVSHDAGSFDDLVVNVSDGGPADG